MDKTKHRDRVSEVGRSLLVDASLEVFVAFLLARLQPWVAGADCINAVRAIRLWDRQSIVAVECVLADRDTDAAEGVSGLSWHLIASMAAGNLKNLGGSFKLPEVSCLEC